MGAVRFCVMALFLGMFVAPLVHAVQACAEPLRIVTGEWPPYVSEDMPQFGPVAEIVRRAFANSGVIVEFTFYPWKRCEMMVQSGEAFAAFPYVKTALRNEFADYSERLFIARSYLFYMKSRFRDFDYTSVQQLKGYTVGGALGFNYVEPWLAKGIRLMVAPDEEAMFRMLLAGRVDLVPGEEQTAWYLIRRSFSNDVDMFVMSKTPFGSEDNYLMISKDYPHAEELKNKFNAGLAKMRENEECTRILEHFLSSSGR